jgi:cellulose synthase/poly-beta-1,6-N-acetylglucosamine synthase-like glycosyltransferase
MFDVIGYLTLLFSFIYMSVILSFRIGLSKVQKLSRKVIAAHVDPDQLPFVSVVISARNERENIGRCLESLINQSYPSHLYEIVAVDDRSDDETLSIIRSYAHGSPVRIIPLENDKPTELTGKQTALDKAIRHSRGEIILTTDADCVVPHEWISLMVRCLSDPEVGVVAGFSVIEDSPSFLRKYSRWRRLFLRMQAFELLTLFSAFAGGMGLGVALACTGNSLAYRRKVYEQMGGFKRIGRTVAEDNMFIQWINRNTSWKVIPCCLRESLVTTKPKVTLRDLLTQRIRWASNSFENRSSVLAFMIAVYGMNLFIYPVLLFSLTGLISSWIGPMAIAIKLIPEYLLVSKGMGIFGRRELMRFFLPIQPFHTLYVLICGLAGLPGKARWKGRRCRAKYC